MGRYEQYVPVQLNYKPFIPNFDKWGEVLKEQQNKYDTFNQSFNLAVPEHIKQDTEEFKIWNNYLQNSKDEVKNAFIKDPQLGNQKLKNKMFELQKEMHSGLYKGLETRKAEYVAASNQLSEEIKDQPWYKQEYYMHQFKASPMNYKDGEFSHINPVSTTKNAERNKKLMEYAKEVVPPHIAEQAIRFNREGEYGAAGMWMINESVVKDYMDPTEFRSKLQSYINANPDLQEDIEIEATVRSRRLDENTKSEMLDNHIKKIELGQENLLSKKESYLKTNNKREIADLQRLYNLPASGEMTPELKDAIEEDYNKQLEILNSSKDVDTKTLLYNEILNNEAAALYPIIPNKIETKIEYDTNDYYKLQLEQNFNARQKELDRRAADARSAAKIQAMQQLVAKQVMSGAVQDSESLSNPMTALGYKQAADDAFQVTKTGLENNILSFFPGLAKMSPAAKAVEVEKSSRSLMNVINNIEKTNIANKPEEQQRQILNQFDYFKGKSPAEALKMMRDFKTSYVANREAKNKSDNMNSLINTNTAGYKELSTFVDNEYDKLSKGYDLYDEQGNKLNKSSFSALIGSNGNIVTKSKNTGIAGGWLGSIYDIQTPSLSAAAGVNEQLRKRYSEIINKHPELKTSSPLLGEMYIDKNKQGEYFQKLQSSTIPSLVTEFQGGRLKSILDDKQTAVFRSYNGDGTVEELTYKELISKHKVDPKKMDVYPDMTGGNPGFSVYYTTEDGKSFTTKVGLSNSMKTEMKEVGINMMQTAKISGNPKAHSFWTQYTGAIDGDIPFYSFSNNTVPGDPSETVDGIPVESVYAKPSPAGITYANVNENGSFYLAAQTKNGKWKYVRDENNNYIHSNNANDINKEVYDRHIGNTGTAFKVQGPINSILPYMAEDDE